MMIILVSSGLSIISIKHTHLKNRLYTVTSFIAYSLLDYFNLHMPVEGECTMPGAKVDLTLSTRLPVQPPGD